MKVSITNTSRWNTSDLRATVTSACIAAGMTGNVEVEVGHTGKRFHKRRIDTPESVLRSRIRGWAYIRTPANPGRIYLLLPKPEHVTNDLRHVFDLMIAQVVHHEALHSVGARHKHMTYEQRWCLQNIPPDGRVHIRTKTEVRPPKPEPPREERRAADQVERLEHVRSMHKRALTRVKRAQTLEKKWRRRLHTLEKRQT